MKRIPLHDATAPIACTLGTDERPARVELLARLRDEAAAATRTDHGLLLRFPDRPDLADLVGRFAADEQRCCAFWGFEVERAGGALLLHWDGPPAATPVVERLLSFFAGDEPLGDLAGLL